MESVLNAVQIVLSIFLMIGLGMFLVAIGWLKDEHSLLLSRLVVKVALPCMIISNLFSNYTRQSLISSVAGIVVPVVSILLTMLAGYYLAKLTRISEKRRGVFVCMFSFSNSVFIGVPVSQALFGDGVIPYTLLYYIANTCLFWTLGYALMRKDGGQEAAEVSYRQVPAYLWERVRNRDARHSDRFIPARAALERVSRALPIPLLFFFGCVILVLLGVKPPRFITDAAGYVGKMVTPLSLFYTGMVLMRMLRTRSIRWQKGYEWVLLGRFAVSPLLLLLLVFLMNLLAKGLGWEWLRVPELMRSALLIQAAMPVMAQTPIVAASSGSDVEFAAGGIALTTALSLVFIPLYMAVIVAIL